MVESGSEQPTALTLDLFQKLVYWADVHLDFISAVDYEGRNRHTIIRGNSVSPKDQHHKSIIIRKNHDEDSQLLCV